MRVGRTGTGAGAEVFVIEAHAAVALVEHGLEGEVVQRWIAAVRHDVLPLQNEMAIPRRAEDLPAHAAGCGHLKVAPTGMARIPLAALKRVEEQTVVLVIRVGGSEGDQAVGTDEKAAVTRPEEVEVEPGVTCAAPSSVLVNDRAVPVLAMSSKA